MHAVNAIELALDRVPQIDGMMGAALVETSTGQVVGALRADGRDGRSGRDGAADHAVGVLAAAATDLVHTVSLLAAQQAGAGPFDELIVELREQHHIIRPLQAPGLDSLFLLVTLDRRRANLALARHQLQALESQIVA
jgi:hypothetical protein